MQAIIQKLKHGPALQSLAIMKMRGITLVVKFALTLFITRYLGLEAMGLFGLITAATIMIPVFVGMGMMHTLVRDAVTQDLNNVTQSILGHTVYLLCVYILVLFAGLAVGYITDQMQISIICVTLVLSEHLNNNFFQLLISRSRPFSANILHFLRSAAWAIGFMGIAFFIPELRTMEALLFSWIIGGVVALLYFFAVTRHWPWFTVGLPEGKFVPWVIELSKKAHFLFLNGLANTTHQYADRYIITLFLGLEMTGIYVFFWQISSALANLLRSGVLQIARPKLVRASHDKDPAYASIFFSTLKQAVFSAIGLSIIAGIAVYFLIPYLNKPQIMEWYPLIWTVLAAFVIKMAFEVLDLVLFSQHKDVLLLAASAIMVVTSITMNFVLTPLFGLWGVAIALMVTVSLGVTIRYIAARKLIYIFQGDK